MEIKVCNVSEALSRGLDWLRIAGLREESRNGTVLVSPEPVLTEYQFPMERVLFSPRRDANPFFHLMEALWMIAGRNDLAWPLYFNSKFASYSDDGKTVHGAYGARWRQHWINCGYPMDQLKHIANELRHNPSSRRMVLQMWNASEPYCDLSEATGDGGSKDVPCNTHVYFEAKDGLVNQTVCCRSNDIIWGAYGANAVHFSVLLEYVAAASGMGVGRYRQFSNNYHLYPGVLGGADKEDFEMNLIALASDVDETNHYAHVDREIIASPIINVPIEDWDADLNLFMEIGANAIQFDEFTGVDFRDTFFSECALPMFTSWHERKKKKRGDGLEELKPMRENFGDWYRACYEWIQRRESRRTLGPNS